MGSTGMSTGSHVHFGGRPLILKNNQWVWAVDDQPARGYIDLTDFFITKPIYNKQILLNERMKLIKKKGESNVYAISPKGKACLLINWLTFQRGLEQGMWTDQIEEVNVLPELGDIIVLTPDN
jgi:murein DD-endopeptidase MepM/ murein hydrolase activator NlpD